MNIKIVVSALLLFTVLAGIGVALTPPPPPPPPVNQTSGLYDTSIDKLVTNATDQNACRICHLSLGTNISGGYNNTVGGVPTRHHKLVQNGVTNPYTNFPFGCTDCHPSTPGVGTGILLDRSCVTCHNGSSFYANSIGGFVGNFSRPHHVNSSYASSNIGNPAANRTCNLCHGSYIANYNDGHFVDLSLSGDFMIIPFATFKSTNLSQSDGLGGNKTWGGCLSCHLANPNANPPTFSNVNNHHTEIKGLSSGTVYQTVDTPGEKCNWCHVINTSSVTNPNGLGNTSGDPLRLNITNTWVNPVQNLIYAIEVRNESIENIGFAAGQTEGSTNISTNGTGCMKCHDIRSLHNIVGPGFTQNGPQGVNHINNNLDCSGCHDAWLPLAGLLPGATVPSVDGINPPVIAAGTATTLTITGTQLENYVPLPNGSTKTYTSVVTVDGVTYTPSSITDTQIVVDIPALSVGTYQLQVVKDGDTLSRLSTLTVVPVVTLSSATSDGVTLTILGNGLGNMPTTNAQQYVTFSHAGNVYYSDSITSWSDTQIVAKLSGSVATGDTVDVITANSGEAAAAIVVTPVTEITVTSPNGGENWKHSSTHVITWKNVGNTGASVSIELLKGTSATIIKSSTPNNGIYTWKIPSSQSKATNYKIRVTSTTNPLYTDTSNANFQIS